MKKFIETIKNIFKIEDLRKRILYTLAIILIYRLGAHAVLPVLTLSSLAAFSKSAQEGLLGLLDLFPRCFLECFYFALGIMPYISAFIVIQLMTLAVPYFQRLQKEGESGRKNKSNSLSHYRGCSTTSSRLYCQYTRTIRYAIHPTMCNTAFLVFLCLR